MSTPLYIVVLACLAAYLIGTIPFGLLIARGKGIDIRKHGSGNIGATNVGRVLGKKFGLLCFNLDFAKGLLPSLAYGIWRTDLLHPTLASTPMPAAGPGSLFHTGDVLAWLCVASCAIIGHIFPVWLKFKGGKGVATGFGALLGIFPIVSIAAIVALITWLISLKLTRMVGISSCIAATSLPIAVMFQPAVARWLGVTLANSGAGPSETGVAWPYVAVTTLLSALVIYLHRGNIARTIAGTENRIGSPKMKQ